MGNGSFFIAVDWGTSAFRLWSLSADGAVLAKREGPYGMAGLQPDEYESVLEENLSALKINAKQPVIVCGMAGAAQGWYEAPYVNSSEDLLSFGQHAVRVPNLQRDVYLLPGIKQATPANVMRGEETQLLGLLNEQPGFNGVVCLPGTHTKWVELQDGIIQRFTTCMTGELFGLLSEHSVLKHSVNGSVERYGGDSSEHSGQHVGERSEGSANGCGDWDQSAFARAAKEAMEAPQSVAEQLFSLRASTLLNNAAPSSMRARLSGLLIGFEMAATQPYWRNQSVAIVGDATLGENYARALNGLQVSTQLMDAEQLTLSGLISAYQHIEASHHGT